METEKSKEVAGRLTLLRHYLKNMGLTVFSIENSDPVLYARALELGGVPSKKTDIETMSRKSGVSLKALRAVRVVDKRVGAELTRLSRRVTYFNSQLPKDVEKAGKILDRDIKRAAFLAEGVAQRKARQHANNKIRKTGASNERKRYCRTCTRVEIGSDQTQCAGCAQKNVPARA
ncbi:MAG: hypothetical protein AAB573_01560 [Patescibacteria group bacterium]